MGSRFLLLQQFQKFELVSVWISHGRYCYREECVCNNNLRFVCLFGGKVKLLKQLLKFMNVCNSDTYSKITSLYRVLIGRKRAGDDRYLTQSGDNNLRSIVEFLHGLFAARSNVPIC